MAIVKGDLIAFNNVETTDAVFGAIELPYVKPVAYLPGVTYSTQYEDLVIAQGGRGSQLVVRELAKGSVKSVKANVANALDFTHEETADGIRVIPIDDVVSRSEKIYEAVEVARESKTGAAKAELVIDEIIEESQALFSGYLKESSLKSETTTPLTKSNIIATLLTEEAKLDYPARILMVNKATLNILKQTFTDGHFLANPREEVIRTGVVGTVLGYDVFVDYNADFDFVLYNPEFFNGINIFNYFGVVDARPDFVGAYAQGQLIQGGEGKLWTTGDIGSGKGIWSIRYKAGA